MKVEQSRLLYEPHIERGVCQREYMGRVILAESARETSTCSLYPATSVQVLIAGTVGSYMFTKVISVFTSELQEMEKGQKNSAVLCICPYVCVFICMCSQTIKTQKHD